MMRIISFFVVAAGALHFNPILVASAFTSCLAVSKYTEPKSVRKNQVLCNRIQIERQYRDHQKSISKLHESSNKKKGGLDESVRTKLVSESIAPWRTLRLFLYFSLGSGAFVGGLITLTGLAAVVSGAKEGNVNTEVRTLKALMALKYL